MERNDSAARWFIGTLAAIVLLLAVFAGVCIYTDPFCHYHAPLSGYNYTDYIPYYLNDGIIRNYDFTGILMGSSMTENFKKTEADRLFGGNFIKIPLYGASLKEMNEQLQRVYERSKTPEYVIRSVDEYTLLQGEDETNYPLSDVEHLYNENIFDDVKYLFNLQILKDHTLKILNDPLPAGEPSIDFDRYCSWEHPSGKETVVSQYSVSDTPGEEAVLTQEAREKMIGNIRCNLMEIAYEHPETTFICFFPPYSICNWEIMKYTNRLHLKVELYRAAAEEILKCPNIRLFSFDAQYDFVCDLDKYSDPYHYNAAGNSALLKLMSEGVGQLTKENYQDYFNEVEKFYSEYDYAWLHE